MIAVRSQPRTVEQVGADSFSLVLASAASPQSLEEWIAAAPVGHRAQYAAGVALPRELPGVALVTRWKDAGLVLTTQQRDATDGRRWLFYCTKCSTAGDQAGQRAGSPSPSAARACRFQRASVTLDAEIDKLLTWLRARPSGAACPSNSTIAQAIGLARGEAGRARARYLLRAAQMRGLITVESGGRNEARQVRIVEPLP
jgi:hypothetical protein